MLEVSMHLVLGHYVTKDAQTLCDKFHVQFVVRVQLVHVIDVLVRDVTRSESCPEKFLDKLADSQIQLLHLDIKFLLWEHLLEFGVKFNWLLLSLGLLWCEHLIVTIAEFVDFLLEFLLKLIALCLVFNFEVLVLQEVMWVECMGVGIVDFVLAHIVLFKFHVLNGTLCC
jgi:hypothetical protein